VNNIWSTTPPDRPGLCWVWEPGRPQPVWPRHVWGDDVLYVDARDGDGRHLSELPPGTRYCPVDPPGAVQAERAAIIGLIQRHWMGMPEGWGSWVKRLLDEIDARGVSR